MSLRITNAGTLTVGTTPVSGATAGAVLFVNSSGYLSGTANSTLDSSGNLNAETYGFIIASLSQAADFDGSSRIDPGSNYMGTGTDFTVSQWVRISGSQGSQTIFSNFSNANTGWVVGISDSALNKIKFYLGGTTLQSATTLAADTWYLVTITYKSSTSTASIYINGSLDASVVHSITFSGSLYNNFIGSHDGSGQKFVGSIDELQVYNTALTSGQVSSLYASGSGLYGAVPAVLANLVAGYHFDGDYTDFSGNGHNGTSTGTTLVTGKVTNASASVATPMIDYDGTNTRFLYDVKIVGDTTFGSNTASIDSDGSASFATGSIILNPNGVDTYINIITDNGVDGVAHTLYRGSEISGYDPSNVQTYFLSAIDGGFSFSQGNTTGDSAGNFKTGTKTPSGAYTFIGDLRGSGDSDTAPVVAFYKDNSRNFVMGYDSAVGRTTFYSDTGALAFNIWDGAGFSFGTDPNNFSANALQIDSSGNVVSTGSASFTKATISSAGLTDNGFTKFSVEGALSVASNGQAGVILTDGTNTASSTGFYFGRSYYTNGNNDFFIYNIESPSLPFAIYANGNTVIAGTGYATTDDGNKLQVYGSASIGTSKFVVNSSGNITKLNNVTTSFPSSQGSANTYYRNDGSGTITWAQVSLTAGVTGILPVANGGTNATAFTAGSVVFAGTSGTYTQDNANFFWDDTNNRLGIGTAAPADVLTVVTTDNNFLPGISIKNTTNGTQSLTGFKLFNSSGTNQCQFLFIDSNYTTASFRNTVLFGSISNIPLLINTNNTERMRIAADGKIGIGMTPDAAVDIQTSGVLRINGANTLSFPAAGVGFEIGFDTNDAAGGVAGSGTALFQSYSRTASAWRDIWMRGNITTFDTGGTELLRLSGTTVGIGTGATISAALHVIKTTEQLRIGYDTSNYVSETVSSTGGITYNAVGSGASFTWSDSINLPYVAKTSTYTATTNDYCIDCTSGTFTVNLPAVSGLTGRIYVIKNSGTGVITADGNASETIDGATTYTLNTQYQSITLQCTGAAWIVV